MGGIGRRERGIAHDEVADYIVAIEGGGLENIERRAGIEQQLEDRVLPHVLREDEHGEARGVTGAGELWTKVQHALHGGDAAATCLAEELGDVVGLGCVALGHGSRDIVADVRRWFEGRGEGREPTGRPCSIESGVDCEHRAYHDAEVRLAYVGTLAWARETGGRLDPGDRLKLLELAAVSLLADAPDLALYRLGRTSRFPPLVGVESLPVPDTSAARRALALLRELAPPFMVNHCLRTYSFSRLIGLGAGLDFDDELLYVASLAHDNGFYGSYATATPEAECFTIRSGRSAADLAMGAGWDPSRTDRVVETVILNANGHVPESRGIEAHLMMRGVLVDVTGVHAWRIHPDDVAEVFRRLPLLDQRERLWPLFKEEADRQPACRGHFADRYLQFGTFVKLAPWRSEQSPE